MADCEHKGLFGRLPESVKTCGAVAAVLTAGYGAVSKLLEYTVPATINYSNTYKDLVPITPEIEASSFSASNEPYVAAGILLAGMGILAAVKYKDRIKSGLLKLDNKLGEMYDHTLESLKNYDALLEKHAAVTD